MVAKGGLFLSTKKDETKPTQKKRNPKTSKPKTTKKTTLTNLDNVDFTFALDIGTRSVVGILGINDANCFQVVDYAQRFHKERAMRDGQIEDIEAVAQVIGEVKEELESRHSTTLQKVCIAAAGRTLITKKAFYEQDLDPSEEITPKLLHAMEYCALGIAQAEFQQQESSEKTPASFYCVGYSVNHYQLDGYQSTTILGHRGKKASVSLIAAFLPQIVVQNLYAVTNKNNLTVENLTLEPIAAMNVMVPPDIRLLNIALVDIGAGTSDIAISKNGSIIAYDMVTTAGDEITEAIMQQCLTDFETAEQIKLELCSENTKIQFTDILGIEHKESRVKILKNLSDSIEQLGNSIVQRILKVNEGSPKAIFLAGGGCQIPGLNQVISEKIDLPLAHIAIAGKQPLKHITLCTEELQSPEYITPIGIGALSSIYKGCDFFSIHLNGKKIMLLSHQEPKVLDALLLSSIKPQNLIGMSSRSLIYYVNGQRFIVKGKNSVPGELYVNGVIASIDTKIKQGDKITVKEAIDGDTPILNIQTLSTEPQFTTNITVDDLLVSIPPNFIKNGELLEPEYIVQSMDHLETMPITLKDVFTFLEHEPEPSQILTINGSVANSNSYIEQGAIICTDQSKMDIETNLMEQLESTQNPEDIPIEHPHSSSNVQPEEATADVSETPLTVPVEQTPEDQPSENSEPSAGSLGIEVCINEKWYTVYPKTGNQVFFFDLLNFVDIDPQKPKGNIVLKLNGEDAAYTAWIHNGDIAEIRWD